MNSDDRFSLWVCGLLAFIFTVAMTGLVIVAFLEQR